MKKILFLLFLAIFTVTILSFVTQMNRPEKESTDSLRVAGSFYILNQFIEQVGEGAIDQLDLGTDAISVHQFEPTAKTIASMQDLDLFIYYGAGLDPWAERVAKDLEKNGVTVLKITDSLELLSFDESDNDILTFDPHAWNDPTQSIRMVELIRDALIEADSKNSALYTENAQNYISTLNTLDQDIQNTLATCKLQDIIVSHDAFAYFGKKYNIQIHPISGLNPEGEPSAKRIAELTTLAKNLNLSYIFFEQQASEKTSNTIATAVGAQTLVLRPLGNITPEELKTGATYESLFRKNLQALRIGLDCE